MRTDKLSVVIPAHNEEEAIGAVLDELIEVLEGQTYEIIVYIYIYISKFRIITGDEKWQKQKQ